MSGILFFSVVVTLFVNLLAYLYWTVNVSPKDTAQCMPDEEGDLFSLELFKQKIDEATKNE